MKGVNEMSKKWRVVCFLNQFFGQLGGEEKAEEGFSVVEGAVGPSVMVKSLLGDEGEVVATIICGDNYFADKPDEAAAECLELVKKYNPDLFLAGPAFNAGRYGMNCGRMCKEVSENLNIPTVTGMYEENPAIELFRKYTYIMLSGLNAVEMKKIVTKMVGAGMRLLRNEPIGPAKVEGYVPRNLIKNIILEEPAAERLIKMLLKKVKGEPFETEMKLPTFDYVEPPAPVVDLSKAKLALVSDGGVCPPGNPDKLRAFQSTTWGAYDLDQLFSEKYEVWHAGYDPTPVFGDLNRLLPVDILSEMEQEGKIGEVYDKVFMAAGNCAGIPASQDIGKQIADAMVKEGITAAILTST